MLHEVMYEELLAGTEQNDPRFPFYSHPDEAAQIQSVSPRSSGSPISKCNSQESIILSRTASVVRKHRSSNSTTSLPELIHSIPSIASHEDVKSAAEPQTLVSQATHKRSTSLAKDVARHYLTKINDDEKIDAAPKNSRDRSRSNSDVAAKRLSPSITTAPARSNTSTQNSVPRISNRTSSRGNYSLFPSSAPRSPSKEVTN
jgi:hypothetical protein